MPFLRSSSPDREPVRVLGLVGLCVSLLLLMGACQASSPPQEEPQTIPTSPPSESLPAPQDAGGVLSGDVRSSPESPEAIAPEPDASTSSPTVSPTWTPAPPGPPEAARISVAAAVLPQRTPTLAVEGRRVVLRPQPVDVGWWSSDEVRGRIGDSFLYAGYADGRVLVSAFRLDLSEVPRAAFVRAARLTLHGLRDNRLDRDVPATWTVQFIDPDAIDRFVQATFQEIFNAPADITLLPSLAPQDLGEGVVNTWELGPSSRVYLSFALAAGKEAYILRILGPTGGAESLFAWDSGIGPLSQGDGPVLELILGEAPETPPSSPTPTPIVATATPTPANILTRAAQAATATAVAQTTGTYTPVPPNVVTPTPIAENIATVQAIAALQGLPPVVVPTPTPANPATATAQALYATAVALTTGTFTPVPTNAVTPFVITPTPVPENVLTAVAQRAQGDPLPRTPLPYNAVIATTTPTPYVVTATPTPENRATAQYLAAYATAVAATTGTFTPTPPNMVVVTPTPPPQALAPAGVPLIQYLDELPPTPTPTPVPPTPSVLPAYFVGKILFLSNREGREGLFLLEPDTGRLARVNARWPYELARQRETRSPDGRLSVVVRNDHRGIPEIYIYDPEYNSYRLLTKTTGMSYDPAWSPTGEWIAFVSQETGNDEIFIIRPDGSGMRQLTRNSWEWDKHPSWSPDGRQIVFWSNRETGRPQLWVMEVDGSNQRRLLDSPYEDRNPVWAK